MFAGASEEQLLPYTSATAIGSFLEKYGMTVQGLEQLQPFHKCEGQNLDLPRGSHVNEGRAEKQRKTGRASLTSLKPLFQAASETGHITQNISLS